MPEKYDVHFESAECHTASGHNEGGWPEFTITLTYYVDGTDDLVEAQKAASEFFHAPDLKFPEGLDLR